MKRKLRLKDGVSESRQTLRDALALMRDHRAATLLLGLLLSLLPAMLIALGITLKHAALLAAWESWAAAAFSSSHFLSDLLALVSFTLGETGRFGLLAGLMEIARSLVLTPLLLSSLALLYNGYVSAPNREGVAALRKAGGQVRNLVFVALALMAAEWIVQIVPSVASGVFSLAAGLVSWLPIVSTIASTLAVLLSFLVSIATDLAVVVIFCYVWICAACEGISGFGALVRSWQLTRNAMHRTIASLVALILLRLLAVIVLGLLWLFIGTRLGISIHVLVYLAYAVGALFPVVLAAITSSLYQRRPLAGGPSPGYFAQDSTRFDTMKRAN